MRVKLLKTQIINAVSNVEPVRAGQVVDVDDAEGKELVQAGYAEESKDDVTAGPGAKRAEEPGTKQAQEAANKMAPGTENKDGDQDGGDGAATQRGGNPTKAAGAPRGRG
jgi:hypothetical protein